MDAMWKPLAGVCALALVSAGPLGSVLAHAAAHAIEDAREGHGHDEDSHPHEFINAGVTPATLAGSSSLDPVRAGRRHLARSFAAPALDGLAPALDEFFDTGPPRSLSSRLIARAPSDRAPPA